MFREIGVAVLIGTIPFGASSLAQSRGASDPKQIAVNYGDLDISSPAGAQALIERMKRAARQACDFPPDRRTLFMYRFYQSCVSDALDRGVASVNSPMVTELYRGYPTVLAAK